MSSSSGASTTTAHNESTTLFEDEDAATALAGDNTAATGGSAVVALSSGQHFLSAALDTESMTVDEIAALIDNRAAAVTERDVAAQIAQHDYEIATMKDYMEKAIADGVIEDTTDENAEDGTLLLRDKSGKYNPIAEAAQKQKQERTLSLPTISSTNGLLVLIETPYSAGADVDPADVKRYTDDAVDDSLRRGEVPLVPQLVRGLYDADVLANDALKKARRTSANAMANALVHRCDRIVIYSDFGTSKTSKQRADSLKGGAAEGAVEFRTLLGWSKEDREKRQLAKDAVAARKAVGPAKPASEAAAAAAVTSSNETALTAATTATRNNNSANADDEQVDPMPDKSRVNRYTTDDNGNAVLTDLPDGVAGYASDGTAIPIINEGKDFNPRVPNTTGDMDFRNRLMSMQYQPALDRYQPLSKEQNYAVVSYMGPKNCNLKTDDYYLCIWELCKTPGQCAKVVEHIRRTNPMGKLISIGVVDLRKNRWFKTAPPQFAKDATATYSNPLHKEQMEAYIREQKRAQVELEQRVMDDEVRSRQHVNTLAKQLESKGMDPNLAQSPAEVQKEIAKHQEVRAQAKARKEQEAVRDAEQQRAVTAAKQRADQMQEKQDTRRAKMAEIHASQRAVLPAAARRAVAPAEPKGGVRRKPNAAERAGYAAVQQKRLAAAAASASDQTDSLAESKGVKIDI